LKSHKLSSSNIVIASGDYDFVRDSQLPQMINSLIAVEVDFRTSLIELYEDMLGAVDEIVCR